MRGAELVPGQYADRRCRCLAGRIPQLQVSALTRRPLASPTWLLGEHLPADGVLVTPAVF